MPKDRVCTFITKATAEGARDRVLDDIAASLKEGEDVDMLFRRVDEYRELNGILEEFKKE